jgi:hypothetical protein
MTDVFVPTDFERADRVRVTGWSDGAGATFLAYRAEGACAKTHLRYPGMRLAEVLSDLYGPTVIWECDLAPAPALCEEAAACEAQAARIEAARQHWLEGSRVRARRLRETAATLRRAANAEAAGYPETTAAALLGGAPASR